MDDTLHMQLLYVLYINTKDTRIHLLRCHVGVMRVFLVVEGRGDPTALVGTEVLHSDRLLHQTQQHTIIRMSPSLPQQTV